MAFYSVWPYFACMAVILLVSCTPLLKWADTPPTTVPARVHSLDGLRGFLAFGVFFHHAAIYHQFMQTGFWYLPPSRYYANIGQAGVAVFFMITGYLFWMQMLKAKGRPDLTKLYVGRVFRIVPLYWFLVLVMMLTVGFLTQWQLREPPPALWRHTATWLAGGFVMGGDVNGAEQTGLISAYVTWSLQYEWIFYASLLVTAVFARNTVLGRALPVVGLLTAATQFTLHPDQMPLAAALMFSIGMTTASARSAIAADPQKIPQWALSGAMIGCLALVLLRFDNVFSTLSILVLGIAFALVVFGATLFGLLLSRPAKRLGDISYGIYLLQGPVFFLLFAIPSIRSAATGSAWVHWAVVLVAGVVLALVATATHALIERPGIQAGQWLLARVSAERRKRAEPTA